MSELVHPMENFDYKRTSTTATTAEATIMGITTIMITPFGV